MDEKNEIKISEKGEENFHNIDIRPRSKENDRPLLEIPEGILSRLYRFIFRYKWSIGLSSMGFIVASLWFILRPAAPPTLSWDPEELDLKEFVSKELSTDRSWPLGAFVKELSVRKQQIPPIVNAGKEIGLDSLQEGKKVYLYFKDDRAKSPDFILYELNPETSLLFAPGRAPTLHIVRKDNAEQGQKTTIASEGWVLPADMMDLITATGPSISLPWESVKQIEDILSWSIGIRNLGKGDTITLVWEKSNTSAFSKKTIVALALKSAAMDRVLYAFRYQYQGQFTFFDQEGRPWKRKFLQSPVRYGRISSQYDLSRLHPVMQKIKPHRGTDFAAPEGTPIMAVADGIIIERQEKGANGNYIRIQHDSVYSTGYLHLSRFDDQVQLGDQVRQGQIIGYVGHTGSASGPHVCLRFWRRDYQDDFVRAFPYLPKPDPLPLAEQATFVPYRDSLISMLEKHWK